MTHAGLRQPAKCCLVGELVVSCLWIVGLHCLGYRPPSLSFSCSPTFQPFDGGLSSKALCPKRAGMAGLAGRKAHPRFSRRRGWTYRQKLAHRTRGGSLEHFCMSPSSEACRNACDPGCGPMCSWMAEGPFAVPWFGSDEINHQSSRAISAAWVFFHPQHPKLRNFSLPLLPTTCSAGMP